MFYCDPCADEHSYPKTMSKSQGKCECCGEAAICNDYPSNMLKSKEEKSISSLTVEDKINTQLTLRGFSQDTILNNRGLIGAVIDETILLVNKNLIEKSL